jgi:hypothetical protein
MRIDLTKDATDLRGLIVDAVAKYATKHALRAAASHHPLVTRIDLNFWLGDGGPAAPFVPLHFDTRPGSEPDGKWSHPEFATLERPHWKAAVDAVCDGNEIEITAMDRSTQRLDGSNLERTFGDP